MEKIYSYNKINYRLTEWQVLGKFEIPPDTLTLFVGDLGVPLYRLDVPKDWSTWEEYGEVFGKTSGVLINELIQNGKDI